jgi:hypothetical protein
MEPSQPDTQIFQNIFFKNCIDASGPRVVSSIIMKRRQAIRKRERLVAHLSSAADVLRGSLLQRTLRHSSGCSKCARGEGHPLWVLTVGYPGGKNRQVSLRPDQVPQVRKALDTYRKIRQSLEAISELNQFLLRLDREESKQQEIHP